MKKTLLTLSFVIIAVGLFATDKANSSRKAKSSEKTVAAPITSLSITGKVIDFSTGEALAGVELTIEGSAKKVYTDFDGKFKIENVAPGQYNLIASFISYDKSYIEKLSVEKSSNDLNIKLQSAN